MRRRPDRGRRAARTGPPVGATVGLRGQRTSRSPNAPGCGWFYGAHDHDDPAPLTAADRCDRCGAQAYVRVVLPTVSCCSAPTTRASRRGLRRRGRARPGRDRPPSRSTAPRCADRPTPDAAGPQVRRRHRPRHDPTTGARHGPGHAARRDRRPRRAGGHRGTRAARAPCSSPPRCWSGRSTGPRLVRGRSSPWWSCSSPPGGRRPTWSPGAGSRRPGSPRSLVVAGLVGIVGFFVIPVVGLPLFFPLGLSGWSTCGCATPRPRRGSALARPRRRARHARRAGPRPARRPHLARRRAGRRRPVRADHPQAARAGEDQHRGRRRRTPR